MVTHSLELVNSINKRLVDTNFDVYSDTPLGKDPDSYSATLRNYHQTLWSKPLPDKQDFILDIDFPKLLHHKSNLGEFFLSSDSIGHTYMHVKKMSYVVNQISSNDLKIFFNKCSTIGAYIIFPSKQINRKMTINASRGVNSKIQDRFDLTLECIRRFYSREDCPLSETLERYISFFNLFRDFRGYVNFFLLQDLVNEDYKSINFWSLFDNFLSSPLPKNVSQYNSYKKKVIDFIDKRNKRIEKYEKRKE